MLRRNLLSLVLARSSEIIGEAHLRKKLASGRALRIKLGIDPTTPDLHLGHVVPLLMLRSFQDAGHKAVLIIGDFTAEIGDPSGSASARRQLTASEVKRNMRAYLGQIRNFLDLKRAEIHHNSKWHGRMGLRTFLGLLSRLPLRSAWEREDFQKRLGAGKTVQLHEAMYPVLQAYDSFAVRADVELGSVDQKLNLLAGRDLQSKLGQPSQDVILMPYLIGLDGEKKMSKTAGNAINLRDSAPDMFGKVMSVPDRLITNYAELAAWMAPKAVSVLKRRLDAGENPRDVKLDVAEAVVGLHRGQVAARRARERFLAIFTNRASGDARQRGLPSAKLAPGSYRALDLIVGLDAAVSRSEARRLLLRGAVEADGRVVKGPAEEVILRPGSVIRVGKKNFFRVNRRLN